MALRLKDLGFDKATVLKGGWKEWEAAEYPTETKERLAARERKRAS